MMGIYEPRGAALEYAPLAVNTYSGCAHSCRYCYVPGIFRKPREAFHAAVLPRLGIVAQVERDVARLRRDGSVQRVHLCFTCDPYPPAERDLCQTRDVLEVLKQADFPASVLTKAGLRAERDLDLLASMDAQLGVTLAWADDAKRRAWEPNAAPVEERVELLARAKARGIPTWVSMEPVVEPDEALAVLERLLPVADTVKVGRWNHDAAANAIDWRAFALEIKARLVATGKPHLLKRGLAELVEL